MLTLFSRNWGNLSEAFESRRGGHVGCRIFGLAWPWCEEGWKVERPEGELSSEGFHNTLKAKALHAIWALLCPILDEEDIFMLNGSC